MRGKDRRGESIHRYVGQLLRDDYYHDSGDGDVNSNVQVEIAGGDYSGTCHHFPRVWNKRKLTFIFIVFLTTELNLNRSFLCLLYYTKLKL